jgi:hypothetical protein
MPKTATVDDLVTEMEDDAEEYFDGGRFNNIVDISLTSAAILTSLIAAAVAAADVLRWIHVAVAAVPAACTSIQKVVEVKARSNWYFTYSTRLGVLAATLRYAQNANLEDFARKRAAIDLEMEQAWSQLGRGAAKAAAKGRKQRSLS